MSELSHSDAALAYNHLPETILNQLGFDAYNETLDDWRANRSEAHEQLEAAADSDDSPFNWGDIDVHPEMNPHGNGPDLVPVAGSADCDEAIYDLSHDFASDYASTLIDEVRAYQESTTLGPRAFVAAILAIGTEMTHSEAAAVMDISQGTFDSKISREVNDRVESARNTAAFIDALYEA